MKVPVALPTHTEQQRGSQLQGTETGAGTGASPGSGDVKILRAFSELNCDSRGEMGGPGMPGEGDDTGFLLIGVSV